MFPGKQAVRSALVQAPVFCGSRIRVGLLGLVVKNADRSPVRQAVGVTEAVPAPPVRRIEFWYAAKKNNFSLMIGPPIVPPKMFCRNLDLTR